MVPKVAGYMQSASGLMTQKEIAKAAKLSEAYISQIVNRTRVVSVPTAEALEFATMICREAWCWPERHWNPYIPVTKPGTCHCCGKNKRLIKKSE